MTLSVPINRDQLAMELDRLHLTEPANVALAGFLAEGTGLGNAQTQIPWPDHFNPETALRAITFPSLGEVSTYSVDTREHHLIFDIPEPGQFAMLSIAADRAQLTYGLTPTDLSQIFGEALSAVEAAPPMPFGTELGLQSAVAFCAVVDRIRLLTAASLVERKGLQTLAAELDALVEVANEGAAEADHRWLSAILPKLFSDVRSITKSEMKEGVEALEGDGLVTLATHRDVLLIRPSAPLISVALNLMVPAPVILLGERAKEKSRLLVRGNSVWAFERSENRCFINSLDGLDALATIGSVLSAKRLSWTG